jgi:hypothetical protein
MLDVRLKADFPTIVNPKSEHFAKCKIGNRNYLPSVGRVYEK